MLLVHFGRHSSAARQALAEQQAETLCLSVLAESSSSTALTQAIRLLRLVFCTRGKDADAAGDGAAKDGLGHPAPGTTSPFVPKYRMVSKAVSRLINREPEDGQELVGPTAMAAALELLQRLTSARSLCLNLLFAAEEFPDAGAEMSATVPVSVSCAFKLGQCAQRLASELALAGDRWLATTAGSDEMAEAEEYLALWLQVGRLLVNLCQAVLAHAPTVTVFLAVLQTGAPVPEAASVGPSLLQGVLAGVKASLLRVTSGFTRKQTSPQNDRLPAQAADVSGALQALHDDLLKRDVAPPPQSLSWEELSIVPHESNDALTLPCADSPASTDEEGCVAPGDPSANGNHASDANVLADIVRLFDDSAALEESAEWQAIAELDTTEAARVGDSSTAAPGAITWEFDAVAHRRRRQADIEKAEAEREAKRQKTSVATPQRPTTTVATSDRPDDRSTNARKRPTEGAADGPARGEKAAQTATKEPEPAAPEAKGRPVTPVVPVAKEASSVSLAASAKASATAPVAKSPPANKEAANAKALGTFVKDHPEFMRVLQNPTKSLSDPRIKGMFLAELENYPDVKAFLVSKGMVS